MDSSEIKGVGYTLIAVFRHCWLQSRLQILPELGHFPSPEAKPCSFDKLADQASPQVIAHAAAKHGCKSVAFTCNDPVIFAEYAMETADACHELGIKTVAVTAGYIHAQSRREFFAKMDAANVDLKGFTDNFYVRLCGAHLQPIFLDSSVGRVGVCGFCKQGKA